MGILPPKTWGDLQMFNVVIDRHFPFAREAALNREGGDTIREIQETIWKACCSEHDPTKELPEKLQSAGTEMLKMMDILQPEQVTSEIASEQTQTATSNGMINSWRKRLVALLW